MPVHPPPPRFDDGDLIQLADPEHSPGDLPVRAVITDVDGQHYELHRQGELLSRWFEIGLIDTYYELVP